MKTPILCLFAVLIATSPAIAHADQVITFEGYAPGTIFTTQYPGVDFNGATVLTLGAGLNAQFPPHSGVNVVYNPSGPMSLVFSTPVEYFEGYFTFNDGLEIQAYDSSNTLLSTFTSPCTANYVGVSATCLPNEFDEVTGADISKVVITGGSGNNFVLDDAEFSGSVNGTSAVPEPASLVLLGTGLLGLVGVARRKLSL
jgi:PEP-CTERM motif